MTSQVGLLNRNSVALASDSATAWGMDHFAPVYNTSEKIYQLAGRQPVGYMNYNHGSFMGHSWDRIFGMYREHMFTPPKGNNSRPDPSFGEGVFGNGFIGVNCHKKALLSPAIPRSLKEKLPGCV